MTDPILDKLRAGLTSSVAAGSSSHMQIYLLLRMLDEITAIRSLLETAPVYDEGDDSMAETYAAPPEGDDPEEEEAA